MADTAKIMDVLHNAKQIVTDAVEKVTKEMILKVRIFILLFDYLFRPCFKYWIFRISWKLFPKKRKKMRKKKRINSKLRSILSLKPIF